MAKPIRATPKLNKKESEEFILNMIKVEKSRKPNKHEKFFIDAICSNS